MNKFKKLPDAEFDIMKVVWAQKPPVTTGKIMEELGSLKDWKVQTVVTLMLRLVERGFLKTEKTGKERQYYPLVTNEEYLKFETGNFFKQYHGSSFLSLVNTLYNGRELTDDDIDELLDWLNKKRG